MTYPVSNFQKFITCLPFAGAVYGNSLYRLPVADFKSRTDILSKRVETATKNQKKIEADKDLLSNYEGNTFAQKKAQLLVFTEQVIKECKDIELESNLLIDDEKIVISMYARNATVAKYQVASTLLTVALIVGAVALFAFLNVLSLPVLIAGSAIIASIYLVTAGFYTYTAYTYDQMATTKPA